MRLFTWVFLAATLSLAGCKDTGETDDTDPIETDTDTDTDADSDTDSDSDTDTDSDTDSDTDTDDTDDTDATCWVDGSVGECWDCSLPATPEEDSSKALNQCSTTTAVVFDNATRIPSATWVPGTALPPVN